MKLKKLEERVLQYLDEDNEHDCEVATAFRKVIKKYRKLRDKHRADQRERVVDALVEENIVLTNKLLEKTVFDRIRERPDLELRVDDNLPEPNLKITLDKLTELP